MLSHEGEEELSDKWRRGIIVFACPLHLGLYHMPSDTFIIYLCFLKLRNTHSQTWLLSRYMARRHKNSAREEQDKWLIAYFCWKSAKGHKLRIFILFYRYRFENDLISIRPDCHHGPESQEARDQVRSPTGAEVYRWAWERKGRNLNWFRFHHFYKKNTLQCVL
mgnify:CR=1 FL=1